MGADPEPGDRIAFKQTQGSPMKAYANRIDWFLCMNALELQTGMKWVLSPDPVTSPRLSLDRIGKQRKMLQKTFLDTGVHSSSQPQSRTRPASMLARTFRAITASLSWDRA